MKLRSIKLNNIRRFTAPAQVSDIGDGLNVLCEPNEHGKSTLFDAIQALFFKPHSSADKDIKALKPHVGGAPEVTIEVETPEGNFTIHKRWIKKPEATISNGGRLIAQADAAEAWIGRLLGSGTGGPSGLVWVRQGMTGLAGGSKKEEEAALEARRDLMSSVSDEVEAMTGGRRMDAALARCRAELADLATATGQKKAGGLWKIASDRVEALRDSHENLTKTAAALHDDLDRRKRKRRELAELDASEAVAARKERLASATRAYRAAERQAEAIDSETRKVTAARLAVSGTQAKLESLRAALAEGEAAEKRTIDALATQTEARRLHGEARGAFEVAERHLAAAQANLKSAEKAQRQGERQQAARDGAARRADLKKRISGAETARKALEQATAQARIGPDQPALERLGTLHSALVTARARRDAMAIQIVVTYDTGGVGPVRIEGVVLDDGVPHPIPRGATLDIAGLGGIEIRPGADGQDDDAVEEAGRALDAALAALGLPDLHNARRAADARLQAQTLVGESRARLDGLAPDGIGRLRGALALIPEAPADEDQIDPDLAEGALQQARETLTAARTRREAANEALAGAREALARGDADATGANDRLSRAQTALALFGDVSLEALSEGMAQAAADLNAAEALLSERSRAAPDLGAAQATLIRAQSVVDTAHDEIGRLRPELAALGERIARGSGDAVEERLAECAHELTLAEAELARAAHEVAVLRRLEAALDEARTEARERYFAPVAIELKPLLQLLWPDAELVWGHDTLLPEALTRDGRSEPIDILSGGTQEQVALLVRLAFARMLARHGRHAPVLLDDALVFTDDDRIERMFDALHRQAGDLQIIVLSCRQRAFRDLGGRALRLVAVAEQGGDAVAPA